MVLCKFSSLLAFQGAKTGNVISSGMETRIRRIQKSSKNYKITMEILDCENLSNYCIDGAYVCILEAIHKKIARMDDKEFRFVCEPAPVISNEAFENDVVFDDNFFLVYFIIK